MVGSLGSTSTQWDSINTPSETVRGEGNGKQIVRETACLCTGLSSNS
jgi:hypothetical protein